MHVDSQNTTKSSIDLEKIEEYLKNVLRLIQKSSKQVINKITHNDETKVEFEETGIIKINQVISKLYQEMNEISIELKKNDFFHDEYFEFCEIKDMIKYTLNRDILIISDVDFDFISKLINNFYILIESKVNLIKDNSLDEEKFKEEYEKYSSALDDYKTYFFDNIYDEPLDKDIFMKYCNIIME